MVDKMPVDQATALSFTRASAGNRYDGSSWKVAPINVIRQEIDGVRLETAATNYLRYTTDITNAVWLLNGTATKETTALPVPIENGGNYARILKNAEVAGAVLCSQIATLSAAVGNWYTASCYLKGESTAVGKVVGVEIKRHSGGSYAGTTINVVLTGEDQRVDIAFQATTGNLNVSFNIKAGNTNAAASLLFGGAQVEDGQNATSPIVRSGNAAATRGADTVVMKLSINSNITVSYAPQWRNVLEPKIALNALTYNVQRKTAAIWALQNKYNRSGIYRFEVRSGDYPSFDEGASPARERSEALTAARYGKGVSVWNAHSFKIASGFTPPVGASAWFIIGQWHGDSDADGRSPYMAVNMSGDTFQIIARVWNSALNKVDTLNLGSGATIANFPRDVYHNIVIEHNIHATAGYLRVWLDGTQIVNYTGPFGYFDHTNGGYWKFGIYRSAQSETGVVEYQNNEEGIASLTARITTPLVIDYGKQLIAAVPVGGEYTLDPALLSHIIFESVYAVAA